jgi:pimeloyl-ACP methyl ester carboxylesterase
MDSDRARAIIGDLSRLPNPEAVDREETLQLGGVPQFVSVRGRDRTNPVLLICHGGPAGPLAPTAWMWQRGLEDYFTVVNYDQRASGRSVRLSDLHALDADLSLGRYVGDAVDLIEWLQIELDVGRVAFLGHSWGTVIGLTLARQHPELLSCYVGVGQVTSGSENERLSFDYGKRRATEDHNTVALAEMAAIEPYPGEQPITLDRVVIARKWPQHYGGLSAHRTESAYYFSAPELSPLYTDEDVEAVRAGSSLSVPRVMSQMLEFDFTGVTELAVPVLEFYGRHDWTTPTEPTQRWMDALSAPRKVEVWFEHSGHMCMFEEPGRFLVNLVQHALPKN